MFGRVWSVPGVCVWGRGLCLYVVLVVRRAVCSPSWMRPRRLGSLSGNFTFACCVAAKPQTH